MQVSEICEAVCANPLPWIYVENREVKKKLIATRYFLMSRGLNVINISCIFKSWRHGFADVRYILYVGCNVHIRADISVLKQQSLY